MSNTITNVSAADLASAHLHPDFGAFTYGYYGIPYTVVDSSQTPNVPVPITLYGSESDIATAPIPANATIEGKPTACSQVSGDQHLIVVDRKKCVVYEYWQTSTCNGTWTASTNALFDLSITEKRPYTYTSADAAGLSIFEGLVRYDEIVAGSINHALRFTALHTKTGPNYGFFTAPATHAAGNLWGTDNIMGMRLRLKANFDTSGYSTTNKIILAAMKKYGMILADNGGSLFFQGTPDARWNDADLNTLKNVPASAFEVLKMGAVYDSTSAPKGAAPVITSFTATPSTVTAGTPVVLTPVSNGSYSYIDKTGFVRDATVTVTPSATTTYTLTSRNEFGTTSKSVTVTVSNGQNPPPPTPPATGTPALSLGFVPYAYGTNVWQPVVSSNSTGAVTYQVVSGPGTLSWGIVQVTGTGAVLVRATQAAKGSFGSATVTAVVPGTAVPSLLTAPNLTLTLSPAYKNSYTVTTASNSYGPITTQVVSGPGTLAWGTLTVSGTAPVLVQVQQGAYGQYAARTVQVMAPAYVK